MKYFNSQDKNQNPELTPGTPIIADLSEKSKSYPIYRDVKKASDMDIKEAVEFYKANSYMLQGDVIAKDGEVEIGYCPITKTTFFAPIEYTTEIKVGDRTYYTLSDECYLDSNGVVKVKPLVDLLRNSMVTTIDDSLWLYAKTVLESGQEYFNPKQSYHDWCVENELQPWILEKPKSDGGLLYSGDRHNGDYKPNKPLNLRGEWNEETSLEDKYRWVISALKGGTKMEDADILTNTPIRRNLLTGLFEMNGVPLDELDEERVEFVLRHGACLPLAEWQALLRQMGNSNTYNPVAEYLTSLFCGYVEETTIEALDSEEYRVGKFLKVQDAVIKNKPKSFGRKSFRDLFPAISHELKNLDEFISNSWHITDVWEIEAVKHMMVSAVARAFDPGCQVDTVTIFKSAQGMMKSTSFNILASPWFSSKLGTNVTTKDACIETSSCWFQEVAEIERVTCTKSASEIKDYFAKRVDNYRPPYAKVSSNFSRHHIFVGSTNEEYLFLDTDNRRFNVIELDKAINLEYLTKHKEEAWALTVNLYLEGYQFFWSEGSDEALERKERNLQYRYMDERSESTLESIPDSVKYVDAIFLASLMSGIFTVITTNGKTEPLLRQPDKQTTRDARSILKKSGWEKLVGKYCMPDGIRRSTAAYLNPNYLTDEQIAEKRRTSYST